MIHKIEAQYLHSKIHLGAMFYQGDLTPRAIDYSFGPGNLAWGVSVGKDLTDWISINARFMKGTLTGDDSYSTNLIQRSRNLSFSSPLYEYGFYADVRINKFWKALDKYKLRLYLSVGLNLIHFNPKTYYKGQWVDLQPLGTEGQTLPGSVKNKYSLNSLSRPIGITIEFDITHRTAFGLEIAPRKTYTDYLDDVSGAYPFYDDMMSAGNTLGANLSNRRGEFFGTDNERLSTGATRGNPNNNDWYTHVGCYFKFKFGKTRTSTFEEQPDKNQYPIQKDSP
ncbi:MAG: hypothetical protein H7X99_09145 [Saprospiraceae bacterium]|nr:hypothetical protein [Saprospiraceae bacterium]